MDCLLPKILVLYHYYSPDDVVSARHYADLCESLVQRGHTVETWPGNRACHDACVSYSTRPETINGVTVKRVWRPALKQHSVVGRIVNSLWIQRAWKTRLRSSSYQPDVILIGTDPILALSCAPVLKVLRPQAKIVHWCFDLYPEAAVADGMLGEGSKIIAGAHERMAKGYASCSLVANLGPCMAERLKSYPVGKQTTLTPWALQEPAEPLPLGKDERKELFGAEPSGDASAGSGISARPVQGSPFGVKASGQGAEAPLALLYSGNLGRAHEFYLTLKLSQLMKEEGAVFCYAARGGRMEALRKAHNPEYTNVRFGTFAPENELEVRLAAPDVHIVSLRTGWTGVVMPSKFFGALAVGRPVLFEGDEHCSIARWIREYKVGWVLTTSSLETVKNDLLKFSKSAKQKSEMFKRCHQVYSQYFSKKVVLEAWEKELKAILP